MEYIILVIVILVVVGFVKASNIAEDKKKDPDKYQKINSIIRRPTIKLDYFYGHPSLNKDEKINLSLSDGKLQLYKQLMHGAQEYTSVPAIIAEIPIASVKDILVKDQTTVEREVTAGKLLLVGPLAFAWKSKKVHEGAFVVIVWADGRFTHETYFRKEGKGAVAEMNTARNTLIQWVNSSEQDAE